MPRFSGSQFRGAMRAYRREARARAEARQAAERARDAVRAEPHQARVVWRTYHRKWRA